jgi:pimeloyl-ACP methyl ester carboxylesterase
MTTYNTINIKGLNVFYRDAGTPGTPAVLLQHGFPTSSHMFRGLIPHLAGHYMFRGLIPHLAGHYHVIAPDLPGFGFSEAPPRGQFRYSFENLAQTIGAFTEAVGLHRFALYIFDYGAPVGLRLALAHPERITAIISQNGNAYEEGLSEGWNPIQQYWKEPTPQNRAALKSFLAPEATKWQYTYGVADASRVAPESYTLDAALLARPGNEEIQLDLFLDYASNVALYPQFQAYFRAQRPPVLAVWGRNDPFFLPAGAEAFRRDTPHAEVHLFDTGHFALETHASAIGATIIHFLTQRVGT